MTFVGYSFKLHGFFVNISSTETWENLSPSNSSLKATLLSQYKEREWETWGEIFMVSWLSIILTWHKIQLIQIDYGLNCLCSSLA